MSERKLIVLGTASQVPGRTRNQNGYMLRFDREGFLFDPGEGTRQMIMAGVSVSEITKVFITHFHGDHCLGLAGIIQRISLDRVPHEIEVYYPASGQVYYERLRDSCQYYHAARLRQCPVFEDGTVFTDGRMVITARKLEHTVDTFGYRIVEQDTYTLDPERQQAAGTRATDVGGLKSRGKITRGGETLRIESFGVLRRGQRFAFVMDTGVCDAAVELARDTDLCVMEATFLSEMEQTAGNMRTSQPLRRHASPGMRGEETRAYALFAALRVNRRVHQGGLGLPQGCHRGPRRADRPFSPEKAASQLSGGSVTAGPETSPPRPLPAGAAS
jgi:ribonuclease Z